MSKEIKKKKKSKGFTLIEILVAVLIVGILTAVAVPSYQKAVEKSKTTAPLSNLGAIAKAQKAKKLESLHYTDKVEELDISLPDESTGEKAIGKIFEGKDFTYTVYGDDEEAAIAKRKNVDEDKEYTLSVDYATGELFCSPEGHPICLELSLGVGREISDWPKTEDCKKPNQTWLLSCTRSLNKDGSKQEKVCYSSYCSTDLFDADGKKFFSYEIFNSGSFATKEYTNPPNTSAFIGRRYDADGNFTSVEQMNGSGLEILSYDVSNNILRETEYVNPSNLRLGSTRTETYFTDEGIRTLTQVINPGGISENYHTVHYYDNSGNITSIEYYKNGSRLSSGRATYAADGTVTSFECNNCNGWTAPERSTLKYSDGVLPTPPSLTNYCANNPYDKENCPS